MVGNFCPILPTDFFPFSSFLVKGSLEDYFCLINKEREREESFLFFLLSFLVLFTFTANCFCSWFCCSPRSSSFSIHPSIHPFIPSFFLSLFLSFSVCLSVCPSVRLSVCVLLQHDKSFFFSFKRPFQQARYIFL